MTIGELARRTGMTVRNIRAHQTRGLLPPPEVHGRTGYYNEEHVARIELTREMQAEGLNLEAIRRVLETTAAPRRRSSTSPAPSAPPSRTRRRRSSSRPSWRRTGRSRRSTRSCCGGPKSSASCASCPTARSRSISPRLQRAGAALIELGVSRRGGPGDRRRSCARHAEGAARAFIDLFVKEIWEPFDKAGRPEEDWPKVREALDGMRPLASDALLAMFQITMGEATEKAGERTLRDAASPAKPRRAKGRAAARRSSAGRSRSACVIGLETLLAVSVARSTTS